MSVCSDGPTQVSRFLTELALILATRPPLSANGVTPIESHRWTSKPSRVLVFGLRV